jgi:hypothetical protein
MATEMKNVMYLPTAKTRVGVDKLRFGPLLAVLISLALWVAIISTVWLIVRAW